MSVHGLPDVDKAIAELKKATDADQQFAEAWAALGQAYSVRYSLTRDSSALELAERNVNKALDLAPGLTAAYASRAAIALNRGNHEQAIQDLQTAARLDPDNGDVQSMLAHAYASAGKLDLADRTYEHMLQQAPNDWTPLNDWGTLYYRRSDYARAEQLFRQATVAAPQAALPWRNLGVVYLLTDQMDNAQKALDRSIALLPSGEAYANRGTALLWLGKYREAAQAYKTAVNLNAGRYEIWGNWGDAYQMLGDNSEARAAWQKAAALAGETLAVNSKNRDALASLVLYQAKLGDAQAALQTLKRLDAAGPLSGDQLFNEALTYELMHKREMALDVLKECVKRGYSRFEINHAPELQTLRKDARFRKLAVG
jgi:Tfp pilus assembly protein PilF